MLLNEQVPDAVHSCTFSMHENLHVPLRNLYCLKVISQSGTSRGEVSVPVEPDQFDSLRMYEVDIIVAIAGLYNGDTLSLRIHGFHRSGQGGQYRLITSQEVPISFFTGVVGTPGAEEADGLTWLHTLSPGPFWPLKQFDFRRTECQSS